jgi:hypothetical protein
LKKTPAFLALALLTAAAGCSTNGADYSTPPSDGGVIGGINDGSTGGPPGGGSTDPTSRSTPPADGTTAWAPDPSDGTFANVRSFGAVGDGSTDDTAAFRAAAATGKQLFVPAPPVAYVLTGFVALQSSIYGDGSMPLVKMVGADGDPDQGHTRNMLYVSDYRGSGLVIQGLHLDGQWNGGTRGEWGHVVNIGHSSNVTVQFNVITGAYGDDVFIGEWGGTPSSAIVVQNNTLGTPYRCNVAVNSANGVTIRNNQVTKSSTYVSAIDLEPDPLGYQYVRNVTIDGNRFDVTTLVYGAAAVSMNNPSANASAPASGGVTVTNNHGQWTDVYGYMDVGPGGGGLVGIVPHLTWDGVTATGNTKG